MSRRSMLLAACAVATFSIVAPAAVSAQDSLNAARDLYASAAYEDALAVLNRLRGGERPADEARAIEQYRAFCLLALGRADEAERAIEAVVAAQPAYHPSESDVSPRLRAAFADVRRRMLPSIIQDKYAQAKTAYDRKDWANAARGFALTLDMLGDPDVAGVANQPPLADLRTLATGFHELAVKAAAPPPPPPQPVTVATVSTAPMRIYSAEDGNVVPPLPLRQVFPPFPGHLVPPGQGVVEVIIDESGIVEAASLRQAINPQYDAIVIAAAKTWVYRPATIDGRPVKYRKLIQIVLRPTR
jgi:tetratricopeptide (TPR) repeat protein